MNLPLKPEQSCYRSEKLIYRHICLRVLPIIPSFAHDCHFLLRIVLIFAHPHFHQGQLNANTCSRCYAKYGLGPSSCKLRIHSLHKPSKNFVAQTTYLYGSSDHCAEHESVVCAMKSTDGPNLYFVHNGYVYVRMCTHFFV